MKFEEMYELARMAHSNYAISKINHSIILIHDCVQFEAIEKAYGMDKIGDEYIFSSL